MNKAAVANVTIRHKRLAAQWLATRRVATPGETVRHLIGVQAQLPSAAAMAVRVRTIDATAAAVADAVGSGELVRTWLFRGTIHLVAADDLDWLLALIAPQILARSARRHTQLGLGEDTLERARAVIVEVLTEGPRTRGELFAALAAAGIDPAGQRGIHLIRYAALRGAICFGPDRDSQPTWTRRTAGRIRQGRTAALGALARRYIAGYGPADARDLASWSGLPIVDARRGLASAATGDGAPPEHGRASDRGGDDVCLLSHFDPYLLGYRSREFAVDPPQARVVWTGGGFVRPTVIGDGRAIATWEWRRTPAAVTVTVHLFAPVGADVVDGIDAEVTDIGRFLDLRPAWSLVPG